MTEIFGDKRTVPFPRAYAALFRHPDGVWANSLAISYAFFGYLLSLLLLAQAGMAWFLGVLLLAHSLVIAAYLLHECTHGSLFKRPQQGGVDHHHTLALALSWLTGACYGDLEKIKDKHLRHHFERADIVALDYRQILSRHSLLKNVVILGQKVCLPAVDFLMHALVIALPFSKTGSTEARRRVVWVAVVRTLFFASLAVVGGGWVLVGYAIAYLLFLTVLNFMDAFQHQYLLLAGLNSSRSESPTRDSSRFDAGYFSRDYENSHTFSNLISERWPVLNLLVLNFAYHNVHHHQPMEPWYRLPALHRQALVENRGSVQVTPFRQQLRDFFRYRCERVMAPATDKLLEGSPNLGAAGVSFLTPL